MTQINVGELVLVQGLMNHTHYNGRRGAVTKLIVGDPESRCEIKIFKEGHLEETHLLIKMQCLHRIPSIKPMVWGSTENRAAFEQGWVQRIDEMDSAWFQRANRDVWMYLILKLASLLRRGNRIGQAAWSFQPRQVRDLRYGYVWGHGGHEQEEELRPGCSAADILAAGSQWWPVIWVDEVDVRVPVYCPGLAWASARPWYAHRTRLQEVETPGVIIEELDPEWTIIDVETPR